VVKVISQKGCIATANGRFSRSLSYNINYMLPWTHPNSTFQTTSWSF